MDTTFTPSDSLSHLSSETSASPAAQLRKRGRPPGAKNKLKWGKDARTPHRKMVDSINQANKRRLATKLRLQRKSLPETLSQDPPPVSSSQALDLYNRLLAHPIAWAHLFFPHHMRLSTPVFHLQIMAEAMRKRYLAIHSPRESSKSTLLTFIYALHCLVFMRRRFIVIIQNTFKKSSMSLETIKKEMKDNETFKDFFPGITLTKDAEGDAEFRHPSGFEVKILCRGVDQIGSIRGSKFGAYRPDLIILDDVEDDEMVKSEDRRADLLKVFDEALIPAGEKGVCQYIAIGTKMHDDSLLAHLLNPDEYSEYRKIHFKARSDSGESLWPEKWTPEELKVLEQQKPHVFAKEYQGDPSAGSNAKFTREDFRYWRQENNRYFLLNSDGSTASSGELSDCKAAISCDLAWKEKREHDFSVLLSGYITPTSDILVDFYINEKGLRPPQIAEYLFSIEERLRNLTGSSVPIGFEKAMLENVTQWILKNEMRERNRFLVTKELQWDSDKMERIETRLAPRYAQHVLYHRHGMGDLELQMERFPYGVHDDLVDALQGLIQLLQYPKAGRAPIKEDDLFNRLRQISIDSKKCPSNRLFGIVRKHPNELKYPIIHSPFTK